MPKMLSKKKSASVNALQMFICLTSPAALLDIEVYEATGTVCADTGASQSEISNAPTRGNTAENLVPDEENDVDAIPETDSSTKRERNASMMPKDRASGSKDMGIGSGNEPRNKGVRGGYSPERFNLEENYTEGDYLPQNKADSEDYAAESHHDASPVTDLSPRPRSYIPSEKRNERTNHYDSNRKYDEEKKGNFYHRSNSDTRGKRYGPNSCEKYNSKNLNYQDVRRQNYDSEVNNKSDCAQIWNNSLNEAFKSISPSDKECFQNNQPECDDKDEFKRQDICVRNPSNGAFFDRQRRNTYRSDTHFQDRRRDSFKRGRQNRGYRNQYNERQHPSSYTEDNYHYQEGKFAKEIIPEGTITEDHAVIFIVVSYDKPYEPLGVNHTSALTPFLKATETQSPVVPLKKTGRPR
ncbi:ubiquitin domain-containing protein UBFD1 [Trichonephila clavipes]|uniref:Ubiquitin domain-containing protein UBFD1 n=1 Tax=Trichonephila clavipes TaxID=2585209 RepID=A0A8X7BAT9_TRICX|nr:ubiquitin domain-containing protein UBFD1 [Trichonephila clavipes]